MELPDWKPRVNEEFGWEPIEDGCIVYSMDSTQILTLNALAEMILTYCDGTLGLPEIYAEINLVAPLSQDAFMEVINQLVSEKALLVESA